MSDTTRETEPSARYIAVDDVEYAPVAGCTRTFRKALLETELLEIRQTSIRGRGDAEDYGVRGGMSAAYVLEGAAVLKDADGGETGVRKGHLVVIPAGAQCGAQLSVRSDELVLLEIVRAAGGASAPTVASSGDAATVRVVDPADVTPYEPAGHARTTNRCLFVDDHLELIHGLIERGGGADRHSHRHNEQMLYVLGSVSVPLLIYYPMGAPHGTGGGVSDALELLVIYSPPLGEAQNALR